MNSDTVMKILHQRPLGNRSSFGDTWMSHQSKMISLADHKPCNMDRESCSRAPNTRNRQLKDKQVQVRGSVHYSAVGGRHVGIGQSPNHKKQRVYPGSVSSFLSLCQSGSRNSSIRGHLIHFSYHTANNDRYSTCVQELTSLYTFHISCVVGILGS
jgi:hypothetical protein